jgi:hypothetical protein
MPNDDDNVIRFPRKRHHGIDTISESIQRDIEQAREILAAEHRHHVETCRAILDVPKRCLDAIKEEWAKPWPDYTDLINETFDRAEANGLARRAARAQAETKPLPECLRKLTTPQR